MTVWQPYCAKYCSYICIYVQDLKINVTGPAKIDHVSANYTKLYLC